MFISDPVRRGFLMGGSALGMTTALSAIASMVASSAALAATPTVAAKPVRRMPVIFIGHGSPMNAISDNAFTRRLTAWGQALPVPTAILSVSAHWLTQGGTGVSIQERPETIHDFGGFPQALFDIQYPAPGHVAFAREAAALVKQTQVVTTTEWGLDHGSWTVLKFLYPKANVPVFQMSIDYGRPAGYHHAVGRDLAALRDKGVLILGSGNVVHNLRATDRGAADSLMATRPWAQSFDDAVKSALRGRDDKVLIDYAKLPGADTAVATPDHYYPFMYALGAVGTNEPVQTIHEGFQAGTLSMRCLQFG